MLLLQRLIAFLSRIGNALFGPILIIDCAVIRAAEKIAQTFQIWTGKDNFFLARIFLCCIPLTILMETVSDAASHKKDFVWLVFGGLFFFGYWVWLILFRLTGLTLARRVNAKFANPLKAIQTLSVIRVFYLLLILVSSGQEFRHAKMLLVREICIWLWLVFLACDPLPPCRSKVSEWLSSLLLKPVPASR